MQISYGIYLVTRLSSLGLYLSRYLIFPLDLKYRPRLIPDNEVIVWSGYSLLYMKKFAAYEIPKT